MQYVIIVELVIRVAYTYAVGTIIIIEGGGGGGGGTGERKRERGGGGGEAKTESSPVPRRDCRIRATIIQFTHSRREKLIKSIAASRDTSRRLFVFDLFYANECARIRRACNRNVDHKNLSHIPQHKAAPTLFCRRKCSQPSTTNIMLYTRQPGVLPRIANWNLNNC